MSNLNLSDTEQRVEIFQSRLRTDYAAKIQEVAKLTDVVAKLQTQLLDVEHENNVLRQQLVISKKRIDELEKGTGLASEKQNYSILAADISTVHLKPSLKRERSPSLEILDVPQPTSKKARRKEREQDPATSTDVDHRPTSAKVRTKGILAVSESDSEKETDPGANSDSSQNSESSCINPQHSSTWKKVRGILETSTPVFTPLYQQLKNTTELTLPKFLVETYMRDANALKIRPHPIDLKVSQAFLAMNYGGSKSTSLLFGHFNKNNPPGLNPRQRCFPLLSRHPGMPTRPGSPGLFVLDPQQVRSPLSLFCSSSNSYKYSDWLYLGEYEFFPVGKMSPECFKVQSLKAKQRWARLIHKQRRIFAYRLIRARIALRLSSIIPIDDKQEEQSIIQKEVTMIKKGQGRPVSEDDVIAAYSNGEEFAPSAYFIPFCLSSSSHESLAANQHSADEPDALHFTFLEEPLGIPASEGFGYFQGGPGLMLGPGNRFKLQAKLGFGTTSSVWLAHDSIHNKHVAIKILNGYASVLNAEHKLRELDVLQHLSSNNVQKILLSLPDGFIPVVTVKRILRHLLIGIAHLHKNGISHTDIKPDNIMVDLGPQWTTDAIDTWVAENPPLEELPSCSFTLADFGSAQFVHDQTTYDITPLGLRAPEVVLGGEWNESVDIWTFGCMIYTLLTKKAIFYPMVSEEHNASETDVLLFQMILFCGEFFHEDMLRRCRYSLDYFRLDFRLKKFDQYPRKPFEKCISDTGRVLSAEDMASVTDFMTKCLRLDPKKRATAQELLEHPWLSI
ncbi:kinase-like protein [Pholiota conissans]|uniref:Kinase-like protein n=1 Tax=Pholiota conissans TaxID=109636 RepID=A0A9P5Z7J2_9AGAR|nr:kinase-like protein [Pholiota conissans]